LFIHLSGPSGVGKTLFSEVLAGTFFKERRKDSNDPHRDLHHCGHFIYELSNLQLQADLVDLLDNIHEQLLHCPFSTFLLDNMHMADKLLLSSLMIHLNDGSIPSSNGDDTQPQSIDSAIFIFTSSIGTYNASHSSEEARKYVREAMRKLFHQFIQSNSNISTFFEKNIMDTIETFLPLRPEELAQLAESELKKLQEELHRHSSFQHWRGGLKCDRNCSIQLAITCIRNQYDCGARMAYGLKQFLTDELFPRMFQQKFSNANFNDSDMRLVIDQDELQIRPEKIDSQHTAATTASKEAGVGRIDL
jgi:ATP-dependent Clp protease ATP-binding subunit ClpA